MCPGRETLGWRTVSDSLSVNCTCSLKKILYLRSSISALIKSSAVLAKYFFLVCGLTLCSYSAKYMFGIQSNHIYVTHNPLTVFSCLQVSQLEELLAVRHSVFVVGGPGTGKSQVNYCLTNTRKYSAKLLVYCLVWFPLNNDSW